MNNIVLNEEQQIKLKNLLFNAIAWMPTDNLKEDAASLLLDMGQQRGLIDENESISIKIKLELLKQNGVGGNTYSQ